MSPQSPVLSSGSVPPLQSRVRVIDPDKTKIKLMAVGEGSIAKEHNGLGLLESTVVWCCNKERKEQQLFNEGLQSPPPVSTLYINPPLTIDTLIIITITKLKTQNV